MSKILLIIPPNPLINQYPSLGTSYLAASLLEKGHEVKVCDLGAPYGPGIEELGKSIDSWQPDMAGVSLYTETALQTYDLLKPFLNSSIPWIAGGVHTTSVPEEPLKFGFDITVTGEGEKTIVELADSIDKKNSIFKKSGKITGIAFKLDDGRIFHNQPCQKIENLDSISPPYKARHLFPRQWYLKDESMMLPASLITSRGCPGRCIFCSSIVTGKRHRTHSASRVIEEMNEQVEEEGLHGFSFHDDAFTADSKRLFDLCNLIKDSFYQAPSWWCESRVDHMDSKKAKAMKDAGCHLVVFGVESGDPETLQKIGKDISLKDVSNALEACKQSGLMTHVNMMFGFPEENESHLKASLAFMKQIAPLTDSFNPLGIPIPFPGTLLYKKYADLYEFKEWWLDANRLATLHKPLPKGGLQQCSSEKWPDLARQLEEAVLDAEFFNYTPEIKSAIRNCLEFRHLHNQSRGNNVEKKNV